VTDFKEKEVVAHVRVMRNAHKKTEQKKHLEDLGVDGGIMLIWVLKK
jgi:hypothetical protein